MKIESRGYRLVGVRLDGTREVVLADIATEERAAKLEADLRDMLSYVSLVVEWGGPGPAPSPILVKDDAEFVPPNVRAMMEWHRSERKKAELNS